MIAVKIIAKTAHIWTDESNSSIGYFPRLARLQYTPQKCILLFFNIIARENVSVAEKRSV